MHTSETKLQPVRSLSHTPEWELMQVRAEFAVTAVPLDQLPPCRPCPSPTSLTIILVSGLLSCHRCALKDAADFKRMPKMGKMARWYCALCQPSQQSNTGHFDARGAKKHETSQVCTLNCTASLCSRSFSQKHQQLLVELAARPRAAPLPVPHDWSTLNQPEPMPEWYERPPENLNDWANSTPTLDSNATPVPKKKSKTPFEDLKTVELRSAINRNDPAMRTFRVRCWLKDCSLAEGGDWVTTEQDIEPPPPEIWWSTERADWEREVARGNNVNDIDAASNTQLCGVLSQSNVSMASVVESFVAYVAEEYGLTHVKKLRGNAFYLLPTEHKVVEVQELIYELYDIMFERCTRVVRDTPPVALAHPSPESHISASPQSAPTSTPPKRDWANIASIKAETKMTAQSQSPSARRTGSPAVSPSPALFTGPNMGNNQPMRQNGRGGRGRRRPNRMDVDATIPTDRPIRVMW